MNKGFEHDVFLIILQIVSQLYEMCIQEMSNDNNGRQRRFTELPEEMRSYGDLVNDIVGS